MSASNTYLSLIQILICQTKVENQLTKRPPTGYQRKPNQTKPKQEAESFFLLVWVSRIPFSFPCNFHTLKIHKKPTLLPKLEYPIPKGRKPNFKFISIYVYAAGFPLKMVQRKVPNKLGIQADHVKSDKLLGNLKASSSQYQDGKNRGTDMKKKMKKSRSIKLSDIDNLRSTPFKRNLSQPGKPPPLYVCATAATPQKQQPVIKGTDGSPNYMKSTTCFDARKEQSQVSLRNTQTGSEIKNPSRRNSSISKLSSASGNKPARALTRTSSLKLMRTLTKTPSFKPARASAKKSSRVVLCADLKAQRSTCSSTLKESKFPSYLMLNPGGTESEGTSVKKVCPYTYCSLNGHHHAPLPSLKCFLSARRRLLKTQKSMKMEALSPRRAKPSSEGLEEIGTAKVVFDDKPAFQEADIVSLTPPPLLQDTGMDFFIEIFAKGKNDESEAIEKGTHGDKEEIIDAAGKVEDQNDSMSSIDRGDEAVGEHGDKQEVAEIFSDGSEQFEVDFEEKLEQYKDATATEMDITKSFPEEQAENEDEDYPPILAQEKKTPVSFCNGSNVEGEWVASSEVDEVGSEATDMEWEEGHLSDSELDSESHVNVGCFLDIKNPDSQNEYLISSDDIASSCSEEIMADEILLELVAEESACSEEKSDDGDSELDCMHQDSEIHESSQVSKSLCYNQLSLTEDACQDLKAEEEESGKTETKSISTEKPSASMEEPNMEPIANGEDSQEKNRDMEAENVIREIDHQLGDEETIHARKETDEALNDEQEHQTLQDDLDGMEEKEQADADKILGHKMTEPCQPEDTAGDCNSSEEIDDKSFSDETQNNPSDGHSKGSVVVEEENLEKDEGEAKKLRISSSMYAEEQSDPRIYKISTVENSIEEVDNMEMDEKNSDAANLSTAVNGITSPQMESTFFHAGTNSTKELPDNCSNRKWTIRSKRPIKEEEELRQFNPRDPNYLPLVPDPEAEKVDLRHQMMDDRKNAEEWMIDHALQRTVNKLAPARKRKVALLVEAFETVMPTSKWETHLRPMQACS